MKETDLCKVTGLVNSCNSVQGLKNIKKYKVSEFTSSNGETFDFSNSERIAIDSNNSLWIVTSNGKLAKFDIENETYTVINSDATSSDEILFLSEDITELKYSKFNPVVDPTKASVVMVDSENNRLLIGQGEDTLIVKDVNAKAVTQVDDTYWVLTTTGVINVYDDTISTISSTISVSGAIHLYAYNGSIYVLFADRIDVYNKLENKTDTISISLDGKTPAKLSLVTDKVFMIECSDESVQVVKR